MRNLIVSIVVLVALSISGKAQDQQQQDQQRRNNRGQQNGGAPNALNRVKEIKVAYITKKLNLTPEQSAKFWPLYTQYQEEMFAIQKQIRQNNSPTSANGKDQVLNEIALDEKKSNIRKRYAIEFLKILPSEKVSLIYKSEKEFQDEVIRSMRERRNQADN